MIILGIDPGSNHTGYGVIHVEGQKEKVLEYGVLDLAKQDDHFLRLKHIHDRIAAVIERHLPDVCAVEMPIYGNNAQSMLKLGRAQAVAILAALNKQIPVTQYTPKEVKKSVTGNGNAAKEQVWYMVQTLLKVTDDKGFDASDALAVCLCHSSRSRALGGNAAKNWKDFVAQNPERVK
jgi:crossover junction endodeoxyribonuclease RuvC